MNKFIKWGIIAIIIAVLAVMGIRAFSPKVNEEIKDVPAAKGKQSRDLNVKAVVLQPTTISRFWMTEVLKPPTESL